MCLRMNEKARGKKERVLPNENGRKFAREPKINRDEKREREREIEREREQKEETAGVKEM